MVGANKQMDPMKMQSQMQEFAEQNAQMDMREEMSKYLSVIYQIILLCYPTQSHMALTTHASSSERRHW